VYPGDSVLTYGAGPVGLMAAYSAIIKGAGKVMVVDRQKDRLKLAEQIGAIPVDDSAVDPVEFVKDQTMGFGADRGCECVGYQAHDPAGNEQPNLTLNRLVDSVRFVGGIGVVGVFLPRTRGPRQTRPAGPDRLRLRQLLVQGTGDGLRSVPGQEIQPGAARPHRRRKGQPLLPRQPRTAAGSGPRGLQELRQPRRRLDQVVLHPAET
jgi:glutathione-independent formaldehyde dehydrogenase